MSRMLLGMDDVADLLGAAWVLVDAALGEALLGGLELGFVELAVEIAIGALDEAGSTAGVECPTGSEALFFAELPVLVSVESSDEGGFALLLLLLAGEALFLALGAGVGAAFATLGLGLLEGGFLVVVELSVVVAVVAVLLAVLGALVTLILDGLALLLADLAIAVGVEAGKSRGLLLCLHELELGTHDAVLGLY